MSHFLAEKANLQRLIHPPNKEERGRGGEREGGSRAQEDGAGIEFPPGKRSL